MIDTNSPQFLSFLQSLEALRKRLNTSGLERTSGLASAIGPDCEYFRKSLVVFQKRDLDDILRLISALNLPLEDK
jgi:hypothetical protein